MCINTHRPPPPPSINHDETPPPPISGAPFVTTHRSSVTVSRLVELRHPFPHDHIHHINIPASHQRFAFQARRRYFSISRHLTCPQSNPRRTSPRYGPWFLDPPQIAFSSNRAADECVVCLPVCFQPALQIHSLSLAQAGGVLNDNNNR